MEAMQGGVCAICKEPCQTGRDLSVDHHHGNEKNRGLLCHNCNVGIGLLKESPAIISNAIAYINHWKAVHVSS